MITTQKKQITGNSFLFAGYCFSCCNLLSSTVVISLQGSWLRAASSPSQQSFMWIGFQRLSKIPQIQRNTGRPRTQNVSFEDVCQNIHLVKYQIDCKKNKASDRRPDYMSEKTSECQMTCQIKCQTICERKCQNTFLSSKNIAYVLQNVRNMLLGGAHLKESCFSGHPSANPSFRDGPIFRSLWTSVSF